MFRITTRSNDDHILLKVEGCLVREGVHELEACWVAAAADAERRGIRVDLADVCHVDAAARALMTTMYRAGVGFVTRGCVMPELVREIVAESKERLAGGVQK
jgi:ABC-type transporter Mla MlaB component